MGHLPIFNLHGSKLYCLVAFFCARVALTIRFLVAAKALFALVNIFFARVTRRVAVTKRFFSAVTRFCFIIFSKYILNK